MQFASLSYFGELMTPYTLYMFAHELEDTMREVSHVFTDYLYILPIVCIPFLLICYLVKKSKTTHYSGALIFLCIAGAFGYKSTYHETERFFPNGIRFSIYNSIKAFCGYMNICRSTIKERQYLPYEIKEIKQNNSDEKITIVQIIGESINYRHMSLFGYGRNTTPNLLKLSKSPEFYSAAGTSSGINTWSACKFLTSVIREPDNIKQTRSTDTNLFRLAKQHGFKTFYLSRQSEHMLTCIGGTEYIDILKTKDSNMAIAQKLHDEYLFYLLDKNKLGTKNFIVLHQWSAHTPYTEHIASSGGRFDKFSGFTDRRIDEYDNVMLYVDDIIFRIVKRFNETSHGKLYIFFTADHNELLGEGGKFGHGAGNLNLEAAAVPFIVWSNDPKFLQQFASIKKPHHTEMTIAISRLLGFEIINPNVTEENVFYVSGVDYNGKCGYLKIKKPTQNTAPQSSKKIKHTEQGK
jgi:glucan phosphoethanolaminetransferase (alkaline phosphatase superfamily)